MMRLGPQDQDADDIAQETTIKIWQTIGRDNPQSIVAWVKEVVDNTKLDFLKKQNRRTEVMARVIREESEEQADIRVRFPSDEAAKVFQLKEQGCSDLEIADALGMKLDTLKKKCCRWRKQIKVSGVSTLA
jgi:DNA-directed RNA polymerase specialized sigma24 family protein